MEDYVEIATAADEAPVDGRERRVQERFECEGFAEVIVDDAAFLFRGRIQDLSLTGCYIRSSARLALDRGTVVDLRFVSNGEELHLSARIMAIRPRSGAGFEFVALKPGQQERLSSLIHKLTDSLDAAGGAPGNSGSRATSVASAEGSRDLWRQNR